MAALRDIVSDLSFIVNKSIIPIIRKKYQTEDSDRVEPFISEVSAKINGAQDSYMYHGRAAAEDVKKQVDAVPSIPATPPPPPATGGAGYGPAANDPTPFDKQISRMTRRHVEAAAEESTEAVRYQINSAVGVDVKAMVRNESLGDYVTASVSESVGLIKTIPTRFFADINRVVMDAYRSGKSIKGLMEDIQDVYSVSDFNAARIARDQMCKVTSDVTIRRMKEFGIERFRWSTSNDERVTGNPYGRYPNAKIKCFDIANRNIGYGPGVYLVSDGATVNGQKGVYPGRAHIMDRCVAVALIAGVDYFPWDEE